MATIQAYPPSVATVQGYPPQTGQPVFVQPGTAAPAPMVVPAAAPPGAVMYSQGAVFMVSQCTICVSKFNSFSLFSVNRVAALRRTHREHLL